jgi:hypothetical protein
MKWTQMKPALYRPLFDVINNDSLCGGPFMECGATIGNQTCIPNMTPVSILPFIMGLHLLIHTTPTTMEKVVSIAVS